MAKLVNRAKMTTTTVGTGALTLGSATLGFQSFEAAGVLDTEIVRYILEDGSNWEIGLGVYTASSATLTRDVSESSNANTALSLSGNATVFVGAVAADFPTIIINNTTRAELVTRAASGEFTDLADGAVIEADGLAFEKMAGATYAGLPVGFVMAGYPKNEFRLTDYLHPDDYALAAVGTTAGQDVSRVTAAIQELHNDAMTWMSAADARVVTVVYPAASLLINDEMFSEAFAQSLWDLDISRQNCRWNTENLGLSVTCSAFAARAPRTSGLFAQVAATYAVPKFVFRWMQQVNREFFGTFSGPPLVVFGANDIESDPSGIYIYGVNQTTVSSAFSVTNLRGTSYVIEKCYNSDMHGLRSGGKTGYQPTEFGGTGLMSNTVRFSNVGEVVTATEAVFNADHVGRKFALASTGAEQEATRVATWGTILTYDSSTQVTLEAAPLYDALAVTGSFEAMRISITASSTTATLSAPLTTSLVGRDISIFDVPVLGKASRGNVIAFTVLTHVGTTITLASTPNKTLVNTALVVSPQVFIGFTSTGLLDPSEAKNDDINISFSNHENGGFSSQSCVQMVIGFATSIYGAGIKLHGASNNFNNFGGNFAALVLGTVTGSLDGMYSHGRRSPRWAKFMACGANLNLNLTGGDQSFPSDTDSATFFLAPSSAAVNTTVGENFRIYSGLRSNAIGWPIAANNHVNERGGANYSEAARFVLSGGSVRRPYSGDFSYPPTVVGPLVHSNMFAQISMGDRTLEALTSFQSIFDPSGVDGVYLEAGLYQYKIGIALNDMSASSGNLGLSIIGDGTATNGKTRWFSSGSDNGNTGTVGTLSGRSGSSNAGNSPISTASTGTAWQGTLEALIYVSVAGTAIPSVILPDLLATPTVQAGSWVTIERIGDGPVAGVWA